MIQIVKSCCGADDETRIICCIYRSKNDACALIELPPSPLPRHRTPASRTAHPHRAPHTVPVTVGQTPQQARLSRGKCGERLFPLDSRNEGTVRCGGQHLSGGNTATTVVDLTIEKGQEMARHAHENSQKKTFLFFMFVVTRFIGYLREAV